MKLEIEIVSKVESSNFEEFALDARSRIAGLNLELHKAEDFARAEDDVKALKSVEDLAAAARVMVTEKTGDVAAILKALDSIEAEARSARLDLSKKIKSRKDEIRSEALEAAKAKIQIRVDGKYLERLENAAKGKRTMKSLRAALDEVVEDINGEIEAAQHMLSLAAEKYGQSILHGEDQLLRMPIEALEVELDRRVERKRHEEEVAASKAEAADKIKQLHQEQLKQQQEADAASRPAQSQPAEQARERAASLDVLTPAQERDAFIETLRNSLAPLKAYRQGIRSEVVADAAEVFARKISAAYVDFKDATNEI